jgi:hypothetical protein
MTEHVLKTHPRFFAALRDGTKTFEIRFDDRAFAVGDVLHLVEWDPATQKYSGRSERRVVSYVLPASEMVSGALRPGFAVLGFASHERRSVVGALIGIVAVVAIAVAVKLLVRA